MFEQSILADPPKARKRSALFVSFLAQIAVCGVLLLIPLVYTDAITLFPEFTPPVLAHIKQAEPPPDPKPSQAKASSSRSTQRVFVPQELRAPTSIPSGPVIISDTAPEAMPDIGVPGGVRSGESLVAPPNDMPYVAGPPPVPVVVEPKPLPKPSAVPVTISGGVQAAKLIKRVVPDYPSMARQTRTQGMVHLRAIIGRDGKVRDLTVVDGHPFLRQAAVEAVKQWVYSPTILGTQPVEVETTIEVNFVLN